MEFNTKQRNNLLTGVVLAEELTPVIEGTRRFITLRSFKLENDGNFSSWSKKLPSEEDCKSAVFNIRIYSVKSEYMEYDLHESQLSEHIFFENLSYEELLLRIAEYMDDLSGLIPQWEVGNPLE